MKFGGFAIGRSTGLQGWRFAGKLAPCQVLSSVSFGPFASRAVGSYNVSRDITLNGIDKGVWRHEAWKRTNVVGNALCRGNLQEAKTILPDKLEIWVR